MSKRFGRNQRRRAREALAEQERKTAFAQKTAVEHWHSWRRSEKTTEELYKFFLEVGRRVSDVAYIARGMPRIEMGEDPAMGRLFAIHEDANVLSVGTTPAYDAQMRHEVMRRLNVEAVRDHFRQEIVARAYINGKEAGIAVSETLLRRLSQEELFDLIQHDLAAQLAHRLVKALKG